MKIVRKISHRIVCLFFMVICSVLNAQNSAQIDVLTTEQGLVFRHVTSIAQDSSGLMWFGTSQGINRYDGYNFKTYNSNRKKPFFIEEENITGDMLLDDSKDGLWYMANDKLYKLQLSTDTVTHYDQSKNIKGKVLRILKATDGNIWVVTDDYWENQHNKKAKQYLQKLTKGKFEVVASIPRNNRGFCRLITDGKGFLWWSTPNGTLKYNTKGDLLAKYDLGVYEWFGSKLHFVVSFFDDDNVHYYLPNHGGVNIFNSSDETSKRVLETKDEFSNAIQDYQKHIWFAGKKVLYRMSPKGDFVNYTNELKLHFDFTSINALFIDATNLLWIATDNGLFKIRIGEQLFTNVFKSEKEGWGNTMRGVFEDANETLFALCESKNKLLYKTKTGKTATLQLKLEDGIDDEIMQAASFFALNESKTEVFTAGKSFFKINLETGSVKNYDQFLSNCKVYGANPLIKLRDGRILFGYTLSRLILFNPKTEESELVFKTKQNDSEIDAFKYFKQSNKDDAIIWIGTQNSGLLKLNLNGSIERIYNIDNEPRISKNHILVVEQDKDESLWIGTYGGGLNHISADGSIVENYTKADGLPDNNVVGILSDKNQNLWISTYNGISKFNKKTKIFQNFYNEDGLSNNEFNYSSFYKSSSEDFYFGGMNGLNTFKPDEILKEFKPPKLRLLSIAGYNSKNKKRFNTDYSQTEFKTLNISPYDQYFEISWMMPSYFQNHKNTYSTTLEGFDDRWFYQGNTASIRYNQLPAGDYILKVKGTDSSGNESSISLSIPITVQQIYYKKWWFICIVIFLIIVLFYAIFIYRLEQVLAMEKLRTKIASDLHDDVGSMLSGLAMQTELLEINANDADKSKLQKIATISRNAISQMRDLVWSIDIRRQSTKDLIERMQELSEDLLLQKEISFDLETASVKYPNRELSPIIKQNLFLIFKEAITNIIRHSNATHVHISIINQKKGCLFTIKDNGTHKTSCNSTGLGLSNMAMRTEQIKGNLVIKNDAGFSIELFVPFIL